MTARRRIDIGAMAAAASRPGIDPRVWLTLATVKDVAVDSAEGAFADVQYQNELGTLETAYVAVPYAGDGYGFWCPLKVDDTVLVAVPMGDSGYGPMVVARCWNAADKPPADIRQGEEAVRDVVLRVEPGQRLKIRTSGADDGIDIVVEGTGKFAVETGTGGAHIAVPAGANVNLGSEALAPTDGVVHGTGIDPFTGSTYFTLGSSSLTVRARKT